jgi:hypothetical protein
VIVHGGALFGLGGGGTTDLVCCDVCGVIAAERLAQTGGWGMWATPQRSEVPLQPRRERQVRHHHCPAHVREDGSQWYAPNWTEWDWAR